MIFQTTCTIMEIPRKKIAHIQEFFLRLFHVIPFTSRQWNYNHWIHRTDENNDCCLKCQQRIATGGNDDLSNSVKHVILNHPEISAWQDVVMHTSIAINQFKFTLERNFQRHRRILLLCKNASYTWFT